MRAGRRCTRVPWLEPCKGSTRQSLLKYWLVTLVHRVLDFDMGLDQCVKWCQQMKQLNKTLFSQFFIYIMIISALRNNTYIYKLYKSLH
jgi:hypothetical protein